MPRLKKRDGAPPPPLAPEPEEPAEVVQPESEETDIIARDNVDPPRRRFLKKIRVIDRVKL